MSGINSVNNSNSTNNVQSQSSVEKAPKSQSGNLCGISVKQAQGPSESPVGQASSKPKAIQPSEIENAALRSGNPNADKLNNNAVGKTTDKAAQTGATNLQIQGSAAFRQRAAQDLATFAPGTTVDKQGYVHAATQKVAGHDQGYALVNNLLNGGNKVTIGFAANDAFTQSGPGASGTPTRPGVGSTAQVSYDPNLNIALPTKQKDGTIKDASIASPVVLAHELIHATHAQRGTIDRTLVDHSFTDGNQSYKENWRFEELRTTGFPGQRQGNEPTENSIRAELGYNPRATYLDRSSWTKL